MMEKREVTPAADPVHLSFSEQRQPVLRGGGRRYMLARGDQLAFAAEVVRFGFAPDDFALDVNRIAGNRTTSSGAPTFTVTVQNLRNGCTATYLGGPGRTWVAEFLIALIAGEFGHA
jgi:hypothetical protein